MSVSETPSSTVASPVGPAPFDENPPVMPLFDSYRRTVRRSWSYSRRGLMTENPGSVSMSSVASRPDDRQRFKVLRGKNIAALRRIQRLHRLALRRLNSHLGRGLADLQLDIAEGHPVSGPDRERLRLPRS